MALSDSGLLLYSAGLLPATELVARAACAADMGLETGCEIPSVVLPGLCLRKNIVFNSPSPCKRPILLRALYPRLLSFRTSSPVSARETGTLVKTRLSLSHLSP